MVNKAKRSGVRLRRRELRIGIDEVGRGPLAGPLTVGAVGASGNIRVWRVLEGIKDSKQLTPQQREEWYKKIKSESRFLISCVSLPPIFIDKRGMALSLRVAVERCLRRLSIEQSKCRILLDGGLRAPKIYTNQLTIIRGDESEPLIAAASIIAKVTRDRYMVRMHKKYPKYGFASHKGYGTRAHFAAIRKNGFSILHRKTFCTRIV
jgi:ribonuclease HII